MSNVKLACRVGVQNANEHPSGNMTSHGCCQRWQFFSGEPVSKCLHNGPPGDVTT